MQSYGNKFLSFFIDHYRSYGQTTTCRVEAHHALLKLYLDGTQSKLDRLLMMVDKIIISQENGIKESFNRSRNELQLKCDIPLFQELRYNVSHHACDLMFKELQRRITPDQCSHKLNAIYGLPCFHMMHIFRCHGKYIKFITIKLFFPLISVTYISHFY